MTQFIPSIDNTNDIWKAVGLPPRGEALYAALNQGVSFEIYNKISKLIQLDRKEVARVIHLAPATLARRAKAGKFTREEGDRFYRLTAVLSAATELFEGNIDAANNWLKSSARGLGNNRPIDMLGTTAETEAVLDLIGRLEHGVFV